MGVGTDLMRFFAADSPHAAGEKMWNLRTFHELHEGEYTYPAETLRAARALCAAGRLIEGGPTLGPPVFAARFTCIKTLDDLDRDLAYGTFDFIAGGLAAVREAFASSVFMLTVTTDQGVEDQGSAFAIAPMVLVTARHCVERATAVRVVTQDGEVAIDRPRIQWSESGVDIAMLGLNRPVSGRTFLVRDPELLEPVVTMGFPRLQGLHPALMSSAGEVAGYATSYLDQQAYAVTTCAMTGGSSGGPVVGADGWAVGVVSALPATGIAVDPGRFGLMSPCRAALRELVSQSVPAATC